MRSAPRRPDDKEPGDGACTAPSSQPKRGGTGMEILMEMQALVGLAVVAVAAALSAVAYAAGVLFSGLTVAASPRNLWRR